MPCPSAMPREVEKGKKKNPHDIDEVPVETGDLHRHVVAVFEVTASREQGEYRHEDDTHSDVNRMQPGHGKIEPEKNLGCSRVGLVPLEPDAWHQMINEVFVILQAFDSHENHPEEGGREQQQGQFFSASE